MIISTAKRLASVKEYYFSKKLREIRQFREAGRDIINLGIGSPDLPPSASTILQLIETTTKPNNHGYQSYKGLPQLRQAMADFYEKTYKVKVNPETDILPLMGSKEGIMHLSMAFLDAGDQVLVPNPGYPTYSSVSRLVQAEIISYDLTSTNHWLPDLEALEQLDLSKVKIMWVNYPNMPTGTNAQIKLFEKLVAFAHKHQILVINDNPYSLVLNPKPLSILQVDGATEVAMELNSLSKSHNMAGWRIGMLLGQADYINETLKVKSNMDSGMFKGLQEAAIKALQNPAEWHEERNAIYEKRRVIAQNIMEELNCIVEKQQVGMFLWAAIPSWAENSEKFADHILENTDVFITPGFIFGSNGDRYVRISLCSDEATLNEAYNRVRLLFAIA